MDNAATLLGPTILVVLLAAAAALPAFYKPYAEPVGSAYEIETLLSVGDQVPELGRPGERYRMVGRPDGLGARSIGGGRAELFMNHELLKTARSEPLPGRPLSRGAFVSRLVLGEDGSVLGGARAYDTVFEENARLGPAADTSNSTPAFGAFCSGFLAGKNVGFSQPIYLTGEEAAGADSFDGRGGLSVAIFGGELHTLPELGRFEKENEVVLPGTGARTVIVPMEDEHGEMDSQLWLYVGRKEPDARSALAQNGLVNGRLFVFVVPGHRAEADFRSGAVNGRWVEIPGADEMSEKELESAADAAGAFEFDRPEDGAASKTEPGVYYFVTTGEDIGNRLGRLYELDLDQDDPTRPARLEIVYNADRIVAAGGDVALSPDNVDTDSRHLMVQEDASASGRRAMAQMGRGASIWRFELANDFARRRVAQVSPPGRDGRPVGAGVWTLSGILSTAQLFGRGSWLFDVQAVSPTSPPAPHTVEDGQLLLMRPAR